ncbi:MAG: GxxExxY protein [Halofilum sp. (in: g-proteobacteria)]|nr:GxxExxY protein [Halofilum sp. (in: g-proteobacteria)]
MNENEIGCLVVDSAIALHRELGPGLLESVYEVTLREELRARGMEVERQVPIALVYRGIRFDEGFRLDLRVASKVILEIKSVEKIVDSHKKQLLTYLKMTECKLGYLLNFGEPLMKNGIVRVVNDL